MSVDNTSVITDYIIGFLLGDENADAKKYISYTADNSHFSQYKLIIIPSGFFEKGFYGTPHSMPELPLTLLEDTPVLFGQPKVEISNGTFILHADFVASCFFLISRYEEIIIRAERDEHGRFSGKKSLPFRAGFLHRPLVDEYGKLLRRYLRLVGINVTEPEEKINNIYLTHDVDQLAHYRSFNGMAGAFTRVLNKPSNLSKAINTYFFGLKNDPWFTFPWLFTLNNQLKSAKPEAKIETVVFIKTGGGKLLPDKPLHNISDSDFQQLFALCKENNVKIGLHPSYQAGIDTSLIASEKKILDDFLVQQTKYTRNHFLANREPEDFQVLAVNGFTDDFTMAYAGVVGFRLGTCRAVKWINPETMEITPLTLHPLTIMDTSLSDDRYMNLKEENVFAVCTSLIQQVKKYNGDLVLLWHNTSVEKDNGLYHRNLYPKIINYLINN